MVIPLITVLTCLGTRHNPWLVLLAAAICCVGAGATMQLLARSARAPWPLGLVWVLLTATVAGASVWCTHFVAILAYQAGAPVTYDPALTMASLLIVIGGCFGGFALFVRARGGAWPAVAGCVIGLTISAMHYVGMLAFRIGGVVRWRPDLVVASVLLAVGLSALALGAARSQLGTRLAGFAPALFVAAIVSLHFTGMAALQVIPLTAWSPGAEDARAALALATALMGGMIIAAGIFAHALDTITSLDASARIDAFASICDQTGLPRRPLFEKQLALLLNNPKPGQRYLIVTTKLCHLNDITDIYGDEAGDFAIRLTADRIDRARQPGFFIARTGRSEFSAIGPIGDHEDIRSRAHLWRSMLAAPMVFGEHEIFLDPRLGVACFSPDGSSAENVVQHSRLALSRARKSPLEPVCVYDETFDALAERHHVLADNLLAALDNGEFEVYYQPQVWIADRSVIGYEALLRWNHPRFGLISPNEFIPLAEQTGAIVDIGAWVLRSACREASGWPDDQRVAVNLSPLQLRQPDLPEQILDALVSGGLSPGRLEIELTESLLIDDRVSAISILGRIRALGVKLALDDFGTGYSSMDVLRHVSFDKIKLDRSFVQDIETNPQSLAILHAMLELGRSLAIPILVEGVETERQMAILQAEGCRKVQGYLTGKPAPASAIAADRTVAIGLFRQAG